jgi:Recombinase zinc beta ribbon domain
MASRARPDRGAGWRFPSRRNAHWAHRGAQPRYLLFGLLVCAVCGSRFTVSGINHHSQRYSCGSQGNESRTTDDAYCESLQTGRRSGTA